MKRRVLTIHGVNPDDKWQRSVAGVLEPHFDCRSLSYEEYRRWGFSKVLFGLNLRKRALDAIRKGYEAATMGHSEPMHLIAHSFGTVLSADLLNYPWVRFDRIIYVGSALPVQLPWHRILGDDPEKFSQLRNEIGDKDWVALLAGLAQAVRPELGSSGIFGFSEAHRIRGPLLDCEVCGSAGDKASTSKIHNVSLRCYGHSSMFLSARHAADLWLPWLWGFVPYEYRSFLELCEKAKRLQVEGSLVEEEEVLRSLGNWRWRWSEVAADAEDYTTYLDRVIRAYLGKHGNELADEEVESIRSLALQGVCEAVVAALNEREGELHRRNDERILALHPRIATLRAVKELVDRVILGGD